MQSLHVLTSASLRSNAFCHVDILGSTKENQLLYCQSALIDQSDKLKELQSYLDCHPIIYSLCYISLNMTVLLWLFKQGITLSLTTAELYNCFICHIIQHHLARQSICLDKNITDLDDCLQQKYKSIIQKLSVLWIKALKTNGLVFSWDEIEKACPEIKIYPNGFGVIQVVEHYVGILHPLQPRL